jgi:predicted TIM-barrel fold metal-dependent hydrolase
MTEGTDGARRIDVHFHTVPAPFRAALARAALPNVRAPDWSAELSLAMMDRTGIETAITSVSVPGTHLGDDGQARALSRACNEDAAALMARLPGRFGAFAALPLPDVDGACREARHALEVLKLDGIGLFSSYAGRHLGDPVLEILDAHGAVAFIHPTSHPSGETVHIGMPGFLVEYPFDTTRAAINLVFSGALDRFPRIRFILSHAGGALPFLSWRIADIAARQLALAPFTERFPAAFIRANADGFDAETVMSRFRRFWYDTALCAGPQVMGALKEVADPARILFGSDWPYAPETMTQDSIAGLETPGMLDAGQKRAIARDNAAALFPRLAAG